MNVERMLQLADVVERSETFDQECFFNDCRTPACVAGHCCVLSGMTEELIDDEELQEWYVAQDWLELTDKQCSRLFSCEPDWAAAPMKATKEEAAAEIRRMVREYQEGANA